MPDGCSTWYHRCFSELNPGHLMKHNPKFQSCRSIPTSTPAFGAFTPQLQTLTGLNSTDLHPTHPLTHQVRPLLCFSTSSLTFFHCVALMRWLASWLCCRRKNQGTSSSTIKEQGHKDTALSSREECFLMFKLHQLAFIHHFDQEGLKRLVCLRALAC